MNESLEKPKFYLVRTETLYKFSDEEVHHMFEIALNKEVNIEFVSEDRRIKS